MHRVFLLVLFVMTCTSFSNAQTVKSPQVQHAEKFTEQQVGLASTFLETLMKYVDEKTRDNYASSTDPLCLPQWPVIKLSYKGREIIASQLTEFRSTARREAPSVRLVGPTDTTSGAYIIDILEVKSDAPLSSVKYRHSQDLTFPSWESQPWFGPIIVPTERIRTSTIITSEALILDTWKTIALSRGRFTTNLWKEDVEEVKDQSVLDEIGKTITALHEKAGEQAPKASGLLPYYSAHAQKLDKRIDDEDVKVVFATRSVSSGFVGAGYTYLLVKKESGWEIIDASARSFTDVIASWPCRIQ